MPEFTGAQGLRDYITNTWLNTLDGPFSVTTEDQVNAIMELLNSTYLREQLRTTGSAEIHWGNITNVPSTKNGSVVYVCPSNPNASDAKAMGTPETPFQTVAAAFGAGLIIPSTEIRLIGTGTENFSIPAQSAGLNDLKISIWGDVGSLSIPGTTLPTNAYDMIVVQGYQARIANLTWSDNGAGRMVFKNLRVQNYTAGFRGLASFSGCYIGSISNVSGSQELDLNNCEIGNISAAGSANTRLQITSAKNTKFNGSISGLDRGFFARDCTFRFSITFVLLFFGAGSRAMTLENCVVSTTDNQDFLQLGDTANAMEVYIRDTSIKLGSGTGKIISGNGNIEYTLDSVTTDVGSPYVSGTGLIAIKEDIQNITTAKLDRIIPQNL